MVEEGSGIRRRRWLTALAGAVLVAAGLAGAGAWWANRDPTDFTGLRGTMVRFASVEVLPSSRYSMSTFRTCILLWFRPAPSALHVAGAM